MAKILPDGTVIPSFLPVDCGGEAFASSGLHDYALKIGTIIRIYYPDDVQNIRKNLIEYDVKVAESEGGRKGFAVSIYKNCIAMNVFGGIGDMIEYTFRPAEDQTHPHPLFQNGGAVFILCRDGDTNNGIIIGGSPHAMRNKPSNAVRGHFLEFEFNGINIEINKDGELILTYKSKTDITGQPQDLEAGGSFIKIDTTGSIELNDNKATKIKLDKQTSDITIETTQSNVIINAQKDLQANVQRNAVINVEGKTDINSKDRVKVKTPLVEMTPSSTDVKDGVVTGKTIDPFTGVPFYVTGDHSKAVRAKK